MSKFCGNCGKELYDGQDICLNCGKVVSNKVNKNQKKKTNGLAISGFVVSILSLTFFWFPFAFIVAIVSLILAIIGVVKSKVYNDGKGLGIGGIVISSIAIVLSTLFSFIYFLAAIFGIEWAVAEEACIDRYGSGYEAKEGYEIPGYDYDDYEYYCCPKYSSNKYNDCKMLHR